MIRALWDKISNVESRLSAAESDNRKQKEAIQTMNHLWKILDFARLPKSALADGGQGLRISDSNIKRMPILFIHRCE
ncbi:MAG: hypothetical protein QME52_01075 [Bacteroidota bacterium]|nr:hypothetical protein [Bacteroidota bacterium]